MTTQTSQITAPVQFPLDRWFHFNLRDSDGTLERFNHNPTARCSEVSIGGGKVTLIYVPDGHGGHTVHQKPSKSLPADLRLSDEKALNYLPKAEELIELIPDQMLESLIDFFNSSWINTHPETGQKLPNHFHTNFRGVLTLHSWSQCLKGSKLEPIVKPLEKDFFDRLVARIAKSYTNYMYADGDRSRLTEGYRSTKEVQAKLQETKNALKSLGYNGAVSKLNAAIKAAKP